MRNQPIKLLLLVTIASVLIFLAGCGSAADPIPTAPIVALPTTAAVAPTAEPVATVEPAATVGPTAEPNAESTATVAPTAAPTALPEPTAEPGATLATSLSLREVVGGFERPLFVTNAGDERLFIVEQTGRVRIVLDGQTLPAPFLDISRLITTRGNEQGLLSIAFHPAYATNGRFFVYYTRQQDGAAVIAEYAVSGDRNVADAGSERVLLTVPQPYSNHNGGQLAFGPDGALYAGIGDGGAADDPQDNGQNPATLLGALLRLDVDQAQPYGVPADNPFVGQSDRRGEIWAWGLRNPWRFSFDRLTGDLYIADVGQNQWEEINFQPAGSAGGQNYGWSRFEATTCYQDGCDAIEAVPPINEYEHSQGCSVTGGYVYRGTQLPALWGNYLYADYCSGTIWTTVRPTDGTWPVQVVHNSSLIISSFGEAADGELYLLDHSGGTLYQIVP